MEVPVKVINNKLREDNRIHEERSPEGLIILLITKVNKDSRSAKKSSA